MAARPIHLAVIDGIYTMTGGESAEPGNKNTDPPGPFIPGLLIAGMNCVSTDARGHGGDGLRPDGRSRGTPPFRTSRDSTLALAAEHLACGQRAT